MKKIVFAFLCTSVSLSLTFCGTDTDKSKEETPEPRRGKDRSYHNLTVSDKRPSLSADGTQLVFISGHDGRPRTYSLEEPSFGAAPRKATPLVSEGIVEDGHALSEKNAWIAPNGSYVLVQTEASQSAMAKNNLYLVPKGGVPSAVFRGGAEITHIVFSNDSKFFALTQVVDSQPVVSVVDKDSPSSILPLASAGDMKFESAAYFLDANAPYTLVTYRRGNDVQFFNYVSNDFVSAPVPSASFNTTKNLRFDANTNFALSLNQIYFINEVASEDKKFLANGDATMLSDANLATAFKPKVFNELALFSLVGVYTADSRTLRSDYEFRELSFSRVEQVGVIVAKELHKCKSDSDQTDPVYGTALLFTKANEATSTWLLPTKDSTGAWSVSSDPCPASGLQPDFKINSAIINRDATSTDFRVVYVSEFEQASSLFFLDSVGGTRTSFPISIQ